MTPAAMQAAYARQIAKGEAVILSCKARPGRVATSIPVRARITGYRPEELVDDVQQGDRRVVILADDVAAGGFPGLPEKNDQVTVRGDVLNVESVDASTRAVGGIVIAYEIRVRGG